jgi:hypothetical protein
MTPSTFFNIKVFPADAKANDLIGLTYIGPLISTCSEKERTPQAENIERDTAFKRLMLQAQALGATHVVITGINRPQWEYVVITGDAYKTQSTE